ncbi:hypothetical protein RYX36_031027, partial [Vicia faba]
MEGVAIHNGEKELSVHNRGFINKANWIVEMRESLMIIATVIVALTFQISMG